MAQLRDDVTLTALVEVRPIATEASDRAVAMVCELDLEPLVWVRLGDRDGDGSIGVDEAMRKMENPVKPEVLDVVA